MGFSPLADMGARIPDGGRSQPRLYAVSGLGLHHNAGVDSYGEASNPRREVSANYWIANNGVLIPHIDEERRAFTSGMTGYPAGANADHRNITVEISNSPEGVRSGSWAISDAAQATLTKLIADVHGRYDLGQARRGADRGVGVHQDWVPTACPGPYVMANLGGVIADANKILRGESLAPEPEPVQGEDEMSKPLIAMKLDGGHMNTLGVLIEPDGTVTGLTKGEWEFWRDRVGCVPVECKNPGHWEYLMLVMAQRRERAGVTVSDRDLHRIADVVRESVEEGSLAVTAESVAAMLQIVVTPGSSASE